MTRFSDSRISLKQSLLLGLGVLIVYFPIIIYVNVKPADILVALRFLIFPAASSYIFYVLLIFAADRIIERAEILIGEKFLVESQVPAIVVSIPVALLATFLSQYLFVFSLGIMQEVASLFHFTTPERPDLAPEKLESIKRLNAGVTFLIVLSISYLLINRKATIKMKDLELRAQQLVTQNTLARFEALKNQVSPHFLFNSLSILSSLVRVNPDLSEQFIDKLSLAYRYILEQKDNDLIPLTTELDFIKAYAFLVKTRFDEKFQLQIDISHDTAMRYSIAPLTLQLLVENAIKHNRMSGMEPLQVKMYILENYLFVENQQRPREQNEVPVSTGIGLRNIISRYELLTTETVQVLQEQGLFKVKIPLIA